MALALVVLLAAAGCAATDPPAGVVEIGRGQDSWRPLVDGDQLELHLGPQGGRHLVASARIDGLWPGELADGTDAPRVGFALTGEDGRLWSAALPPVRRPFVPCPEGGFEIDGGSRVFLIDGAEALDGESAELRVDVEDALGSAAADARTVRIRVAADR